MDRREKHEEDKNDNDYTLYCYFYCNGIINKSKCEKCSICYGTEIT